MLKYPIFYRRYGIRRVGHLERPLFNPIVHLALPENSLYHHLEDDPESFGVSSEDPLMPHDKSLVAIDTLTQYSSMLGLLGAPHRIATNPTQLMQKYFQDHHQYKPLARRPAMSHNPKTLLVENYGLLQHLYRYQPNKRLVYFRWHNYWDTITKNVIAADQYKRNQFILMPVPTLLPPVSLLKSTEAGNTNQLASLYHDHGAYYTADLWTWLGTNPDKSMFGRIPVEMYERLNFVWIIAGRWVTLNVGVFHKWIITEDNPHGVFKSRDVQKRFLHFLMMLTQSELMDVVETAEDDGVDSDTVAEVDEHGKPIESHDGVTKSAMSKDGYQPPMLKQNLTKAVTKLRIDASHEITDHEDDEGLSPEELLTPSLTDQEIEKQLALLEDIHAEHVAKQLNLEVYKPYVPVPESRHEAVTKLAKDMGSRGLCTPAEVRRMDTIAKRYQVMPSPFNKEQTLEQFSVIAKEDLAIGMNTPISKPIPGVLDHSMLSSSLKHFDPDYIRNVHHKDVANMVLDVQRGAIAVQDYTVTSYEDINDSYDVHRVKVVPVIGKSTTLTFRLPKISTDGTFMAGGVKYRMRKQRSDIPIRKISPTEVALTSYWSKVFVQRSPRAQFDFTQWIQNKVMALSLDPSSGLVDLMLGSCFDNTYDLPRVYTAMAMKYGSFEYHDYRFFWNINDLEKNFPNVPMGKLLKGKHPIPIGYHRNNIIYMDYKGYIGEMVALAIKPIGTLQSILGLTELYDIPVDMAEIKIFSYTTPLGFALAYHIGLGNLLETVGAKFRRAAKGSNYNMAEHEFAVRFSDETLIFDRNDPVSVLLFNGFNRYKPDIKQWSVYAFDKKEVYGTIWRNAFQSAPKASRLARELGLMFNMWVDSITRDILVEMNEPTDMVHLLLKAVDMLASDKHPDAMSTLHMRDRGYERFAGFVYSSIANAIRTYAAKPANANSSVDLNPEDVWMQILKDQTVMPVEDSNPIHALKEQEVVVYSGAGGRSSRALTEKHRAFHEDSLGLVSESSPDNADVGAITYLTADPNYSSVRGLSRKLGDPQLAPAAKLVSTSMMLAPAADRDDQQWRIVLS